MYHGMYGIYMIIYVSRYVSRYVPRYVCNYIYDHMYHDMYHDMYHGMYHFDLLQYAPAPTRKTAMTKSKSVSSVASDMWNDLPCPLSSISALHAFSIAFSEFLPRYVFPHHALTGKKRSATQVRCTLPPSLCIPDERLRFVKIPTLTVDYIVSSIYYILYWRTCKFWLTEQYLVYTYSRKGLNDGRYKIINETFTRAWLEKKRKT